MFTNNQMLKNWAQQASNFKAPYLVPPESTCNYCQLLKKYPNLAGTHVNGCSKIEKNKDINHAVRDKWRQNPIIDPNTGEKWWIE
jgi:hypothetical protein